MTSIHAKSRDNARTPMQWDASENAGFTKGTPWIKVNPNYIEINAEKQINDPDSVFACYKKLIQLRKQYDVIVDGRFELLLPEDKEFFAYMRENPTQKLYVICNFYGNEAACPLDEPLEKMELLYCNYKETQNTNIYRPYEARIYYMAL
jgi:glucan 1,6-alpha-glucosidase